MEENSNLASVAPGPVVLTIMQITSLNQNWVQGKGYTLRLATYYEGLGISGSEGQWKRNRLLSHFM